MKEPMTGDAHLYRIAPDKKCYQCGESVRSESFETRIESIDGVPEYFHSDGCFDDFIRESQGYK